MSLEHTEQLVIGEWAHPDIGEQVSAVQGLPSSQETTTPVAEAQAPLKHVVFSVQALLSSQGAELKVEPQPVSESQKVVRQGFGLEQSTGAAPPQAPEMQTLLCVQASPSLQGVKSGALGFEQSPVLVLQNPCTWHWSKTVQCSNSVTEQTPLTH